MTEDARALVVVPTYNERDNLPGLVRRLLENPGVGVLVVDDQSPDGTGHAADELVAGSGGRLSVLHRRGPRGLGLSYIDGLKEAVRSGAALICQMDADFSHDPADIPRLLDAAGRADLVIGSRYVDGGRIENWPLHRLLLSSFANRYVRALTGIGLHDCTSGFRCWRREALERIPFDHILSDDYSFLVELAWEAARAGCRISEVPITFVERRLGTSKLSARALFESALIPWRLALRGRLR